MENTQYFCNRNQLTKKYEADEYIHKKCPTGSCNEQKGVFLLCIVKENGTPNIVISNYPESINHGKDNSTGHRDNGLVA